MLKRKEKYFYFSSKDPKKIILTSVSIDFAACLLDYLEDKYIALDDSTDKNITQSRILTFMELKKCQSEMFLELNKIIELIDDTKTKDFIISNTGINENIAFFIFSNRLFCEPDLRRQFKKVKIATNSEKDNIISKVNMIFWIQVKKILFFLLK